ncbi:MAG: HAMP domain-containing protein [Candidatus Accumulibacter sp.]|jgi:nitrogen fixation/metabolism regulation signal transduction histidine kinase|nr:HAMP domain-containing protein [Accumulibacter sp.]
MKKAIAIVAASLAGILLFLLASASANSSLFARHYSWLLGINVAVAASLFALVVWQMWNLRIEYRSRLFGSRLKLRLVLAFGLMAVLPGVLIYAVSVQFLTKSIESWFNVRVENALESGLNLGYEALSLMRGDLGAKARDMALELGEQADPQWNAELVRLREQMNVQSAGLFAVNGQLIAAATGDLSVLRPSQPTAEQINRARISGRMLSEIETSAPGEMMVRVLVPIQIGGIGQETRILQLTQAIPASLAANAEQVQAVYKEYQELSLGREGLTKIYAVTLTLTVLLALFSAIAVAFILARRLSEPLSILAEGTQAVASGDFTPRQAIYSRDELGMLTQSFSRMTRQLDEARRETERHRIEVEAAHAYLESVLASVSTGVLVFDGGFLLRIANKGAKAILDDDFDGLLGASVEVWGRARFLGDAIRKAFFKYGDTEWQAQIGHERPGAPPQILLLHGATLQEGKTGGVADRVVVFDDVTQLIEAQRSAAWGEIARRLAHEIKNPLTPIQLSAERLRVKLEGKLRKNELEMLERSTQVIINQVQALKRMVDEFSEYARLPSPDLEDIDLNALVAEVLGLYESSGAVIRRKFEKALPMVRGDASQLRQIIHNLLRNAEHAVAENASSDIWVATRAAGDAAELSVADSGPGFPPEVLPRVFEPYVTTKPGGTGLGLSIVKKIVEEHQGQIKIKSGHSGGAEICIRLPLAPAQPERAADEMAEEV